MKRFLNKILSTLSKSCSKCRAASLRLLQGALKSLLILFFLFSQVVSAQTVRPTSFENRDICEDSKGVWRQFGNGCADECQPKLDRFSICTQALVYGCECGKGRCWNENACISLQDYKKIYAVKHAEEQKILDAAREKRKDAARANQEAIMLRLVPPPAPDPNAPKVNPAPVQQAPVQQAAAPKTATPAEMPFNTQQPFFDETSAITQIPAPIPAPPAVVNSTPPKEIEIPQFLLKKQAQQAKTSESKPATEAIIPPGLPVIPLPN